MSELVRTACKHSPQFTAKTGLTVNVVVQGTGKALDTARRKEKWYSDIGGGMGKAHNAARAMDAYTLLDRGTLLSFNNEGSLIVAIEGDLLLLNRYDVIELNPQKHASAKLTVAKVFADWLVSPEGSKQSEHSK